MSASIEGDWTDWIAASSSCGACGKSCRTSTACPFSRTKRASMSVEVGSGSVRGIRRTRATKNGHPVRNSTI
jgi:hypothetical protein